VNGRRRPLSQLSPALRFVLLVGVMSFFADFTYEGSRSVIGQYLATLGAGALAISAITGLGEFLGYGLRLVSGRAADRSERHWPITIGGYVLQMSVVPLLALAGSWPVAAVLIVLERVGKATRNPPRDAMLSHAAQEMGFGWGFGVHEALDQFGAMFGPLAVALVLGGVLRGGRVSRPPPDPPGESDDSGRLGAPRTLMRQPATRRPARLVGDRP
jgi:MFS family permease